jgi:hypothetical protein
MSKKFKQQRSRSLEKLADKLLKQDEKNQKLKTKKINLDKFFK